MTPILGGARWAGDHDREAHVWVDGSGGVLSWLLDSPLGLPCPLALEWMTSDELDGYYLLFDNAGSPDTSCNR